MKKLQISLVALLMSASFAMAQPPAKMHDKQPGHHRKEMGMQQLNLSDDQKAKMKAANEDFHSKIQALNSNENQTVKQQRDQREALAKAHKAQVESILTADQKSKLVAMKADAKKRHEEMGAKHLDKMKQELNLSDQQVSQLKSNQDAIKSKLEAIHNNTSLDRSAKMQQMKALRDDMKSNFDKVLTPEQKEKWQGMKKDRSHKMKGHFKKRMPAEPAV